MTGLRGTNAERLARHTETTDDGCIVFTGYRINSGYALLWDADAGKKRLVHRIAHEIYIGPIPDGYQVDHLCSNRVCVNPAHLEAVTPLENTQRVSRRRTHCLRGHEFTPANTRQRGDRLGRVCRACDAIRANEYRERRAA